MSNKLVVHHTFEKQNMPCSISQYKYQITIINYYEASNKLNFKIQFEPSKWQFELITATKQKQNVATRMKRVWNIHAARSNENQVK